MLPKFTEMERNWIKFTPFGFMKNLRDNQVKFTGKNKIGSMTCAKLHGLIGQKQTDVRSMQWSPH